VAEVATGFLLQAIDAEGPQATLREVVAPVLVARASTGVLLPEHEGRKGRHG
jgi:hypothetical protein